MSINETLRYQDLECVCENVQTAQLATWHQDSIGLAWR